MPSPFPGMNPYLEHPDLWSEVHNRLVVALADSLAVPLRPRYYVAIEKRTYFSTPEESILVGIPDVSILSKTASSPQVSQLEATATLPFQKPLRVTVPMMEEVRESYLEIRELKTGAVITTIEVLSPKNKRAGDGREAYLRKRYQVLASYTHLVEIDLLRAGTPMPLVGLDTKTDYRILVSRSTERPVAQLYAFNLQQPIPVFPLPLHPGDTEPQVDLKLLLDGVYNRAGFDLRIDYSQPPQPPLSEAEQAWANTLLAPLLNQ
ncbi:DUF4058 family protein [Leptolyngbya sp. NK1-12]|uniref:DUF4058 family protein n=1 Tax=Leptolyngbya sp. NK1-12 TaxID=2547451 RepID=A0AA96WV15_9CYAN|nr:DUF4058 family protein [Leptolyngbya sp. NK1-12]WNZ23997.1 DUF4058 family protein [Leptolyngbya sp. NK1-12]